MTQILEKTGSIYLQMRYLLLACIPDSSAQLLLAWSHGQAVN